MRTTKGLEKIKVKIIRRLNSLIFSQHYFVQYLNSWFAGRKARVFTKENLFFPSEIQRILKKQHPRIDRMIVKRTPKLIFKIDNFGRRLIEIDQNYTPEQEIRTDPRPYQSFAKIIMKTFFSTGNGSLLDIGCSTGILVKELASKNRVDAFGLEIFVFQ